MGRNNKKYHKTLHQQVYDRLTSMLEAGVGKSKHQAKIEGTFQDAIFSYNSYKTYAKHCGYFIDWLHSNYP